MHLSGDFSGCVGPVVLLLFFYFLQFSLCLLLGVEVLDCDSFMVLCFFSPTGSRSNLTSGAVPECLPSGLPSPLGDSSTSVITCLQLVHLSQNACSCCTVPRLFLRNTVSFCRSGHFDPLGALPWCQV